jgi:hypothetical protein
MESSTLLNVLVWAESYDRAAKLAEAFSKGTEKENTEWSGNHGNYQVKAYVRVAGGIPFASPDGVTDVLLVDLDDKDYLKEQAKVYIDRRRGIPLRFIASNDGLSDFAQELGCDFLTGSSLTSGETINKVLNSAIELDTTLRNTFNSFDLNGNGVITADELVKASSKLGHELNSEESKILVNSLSNNGGINFKQFKSWYVMGRGDFNTFRRLVQVELSIGGLIKQSSQAFNSYLQRVKNENQTEEISYAGRINVGPLEDFDTGFGFDLDFAGGKDYENIVNNLPSYYKSSPITFSLEIRVNDQSTASTVRDTLEGLKAFADAIPQVSQAQQAGVDVNFRSAGTSVFVDLSFGGFAADRIMAQMGQFNFSQLNFAGTGNFSVFSGLRFSDIISGTVGDLVSRLVLFKLESHSEFSNTKALLHGVASLLSTVKQFAPKEVRGLTILLKLVAAVRKVGFEYKYDANDVASVAKEILGEVASEKFSLDSGDVAIDALNTQLEMYQGMGLGMLDGVKPMIESVIEPFKPALEAGNFDKLSVIMSLPTLKFHCKSTIHLPGLTAFVNDKVLN